MNQFRKIALLICALALMVMVPGSIAGPVSDNRELMVLFTHDLHSYFLPHRVLTEQGNQMQQGGYAKLAYLIKGEQILQRNKIIVVDAGDFSMGTLFHTSLLQEASELRLMGKMGYDVVTFGNAITYGALFIGFIFLCVLVFLVWLVIRKIRSSGKIK
jgi:2',3'-cyclic-nucleotide 2'-phosphodiesterase (5'-nucleotidase family)